MSYGYSTHIVKLNKQASARLPGVKLGRLCIANDIPVSEMAEDLGVTRQTLYNWFIGATNPANSCAGAVQAAIARLK
tara:strand:+ start:600 stop:830 length:231 start_codon:yes stop_codon:yes gene_type:complete